PGWGGSQRLPRLIGPGLAAELIFTGRRVDAAEALRLGLLSAAYEPEHLLARAIELADGIAANSPACVQDAKRRIAMAAGEREAGFAAELDAFTAAFDRTDQREGMHAFLERRKPVFADGESR